MSGNVFSERCDFGNALIAEGIRATELTDTASQDATWGDFQSSANPLSTPHDRGWRISLIPKCDQRTIEIAMRSPRAKCFVKK